MYLRQCVYCKKEFKSTQPNAKYCCKYHAGKARAKRYLEKRRKELK
ncbi:MAG: hypothetical protein E6902_13330 [Paeniclostridium sordellii]|nr:hypothetical protein [Paeniclostridium sordellii]